MPYSVNQIRNYPIDENTYIVSRTDTSVCIVVDPFEGDSVIDYVDNTKLQPAAILLTHEHYDHIAAADTVRLRYNAKVVCTSKCSQRIQNPTENLSAFFGFQLSVTDRFSIPQDYIDGIMPFSAAAADFEFSMRQSYCMSDMDVICVPTPGHTDASACYLVGGTMLFSGDTLLKNEDICTKLPTGSWKDYCLSTLAFLKGLESDTVVYPGHGDVFILGDKLAQDS